MRTVWLFLGAAFAALAYLISSDSFLQRPQYPDGLPAELVPSRPFPVPLINALGQFALEFAGVDPFPLDPDAIEKAAIEKTGGLVDFGDNAYRRGLEVACDSFRNDAKLTFLGRMFVHTFLVGSASRLLEITDYVKTHDEVPSQKVDRPVVILGLPRTGTTLMHNMLTVGLNKTFRAPLHWETVFPVPPPESTISPELQERIDEADKKLTAFKQLAPGLDHFHPMGVFFAEECILIFAPFFQSLALTSLAPIATYNKWLMGDGDGLDRLAAMQWHKKFLQLLQSGSAHGSRRWLIKTPQHLALIEEILQVYPDALIINMHRSPSKAIASMSSVLTKTAGMATNYVNTSEIALSQAHYWERSAARAFAAREKHASEIAAGQYHILDVSLDDIKKNVTEVLLRVTKFMNHTVTNEELQTMVEFQQSFGYNQHSKHKPPTHLFGMDSPSMAPYLSDDSFLQRYFRKFSP